jgi:hypothetical protein
MRAMIKKKMTLDNLAGTMQREFSNLNEKLDTKIGKREFRGEMKKQKTDMKELRLSNGRIEKKLDAEAERHDDQDLRIKNHEERIIVLEKDKELV